MSRQCMSEGVVGVSTKDRSEGLCNPANRNELQTSPSGPSVPCSGNPKRTGTSALQPVSFNLPSSNIPADQVLGTGGNLFQVKTIDTVVKDITPEESLVASTFVASVIQSAAVRTACYMFSYCYL